MRSVRSKRLCAYCGQPGAREGTTCSPGNSSLPDRPTVMISRKFRPVECATVRNNRSRTARGPVPVL